MSEPLVLPTIPQCTIAPSAVHGNGLFTQQPIPAEQVLCHLDGQHIAWSDYAKQKGFSGEWNAIDGDILVVRPFRTFYYYINHSHCGAEYCGFLECPTGERSTAHGDTFDDG